MDINIYSEDFNMPKSNFSINHDERTSEGISYRIRALRLYKNLTLAKIAEATSLNKSYLSRIERGEKSPSVSTLIKIANALEVQIGYFFGEELHEDVVTVVRADEFTAVVNSDGNVVHAMLSSQANNKIGSFIVYPSAEPVMKTAAHAGEEMIYVLNGQVEVSVVNQDYTLKTGDTIRFEGHTRHKIRQIGKEQARLLVVIINDFPELSNKNKTS